MARRTRTPSDTKIKSLEQKLGKQDTVLEKHGEMLTLQKQASEDLNKYVQEILLILGGSASLEVPGMRAQMREVVEKVKEIPAMKKQLQETTDTVNEVDAIVQKIQTNKGFWTDIRTKAIAGLVVLGTLLSIAVALKELIIGK